MPNPVVHFEVLGRDADALKRFYQDTFGWGMESVMPTYAMARPEAGSGIDGGVGATPDGASGHVTFYVQVEDLQQALAKGEANGGSTQQPQMALPDSPSLALVAAPRG